MTARAVVLAVWLGLGACQEREAEQQSPPQPAPANSSAAEAPLPVLLRYKPAGQGGPEAFMAANVHGVLDLTGPCVRLQNSEGEFRTVVSAFGSRIGRDFAGAHWQAGKERLRHGSSVIGGGGETPLPPDQMLDGPAPEACRAGPAVELIGPTLHGRTEAQ